MRSQSWLVVGLLLVLVPVWAGAEQQRSRQDKPRLIRDDRITEPAEPEAVTPDPNEARRNIQVGDFYFKKGNLAAARERYREAIKYGPAIADGYEKLVETLRRLDDAEAAIETCRLFLKVNPNSDRAEQFRKKLEELEKGA